MNEITPAKRPTLTTLKAFIRKNRANLLVQLLATFDGMTDCVESIPGAKGWAPAQDNDRPCLVEESLGIKGVYVVRGGGDYIRPYRDGDVEGFEVSNCCGRFNVGVRVADRKEAA